MVKRAQYNTQGQKRQEEMHELDSPSWKGKPKERLSCKQLKRIFELLPDGILVCDQEGMIVRINAAAHLLFEVGSSACWKGKSSQQFLQDYQPSDPWQRSTSPDSWLMDLVSDDKAGSGSPERTFLLHMPSGRQVYVNYWYVPLFDAAMCVQGSFSIFQNITHRYQKALHLQRVRAATNALTATIAHLPAHLDLASSEDRPLLSAPVIFVAKSLVNVIRQVLECRRVSLVAFGPSGHDYLVAGSGLTPEQEQFWQHLKGGVPPLEELVDETVLARLSAHQEVILTDESIRRPHLLRAADGPDHILLVPLFLKQQWVGVLAIVKAEVAGFYTPEEVELVRAVAAQTLLIIQCLLQFHQEVEGHRALAQYEIQRLSDDFLTLASHELLTPLTGIFGNIQLAQRRLETLKRCAVEQPERVPESIEQAQYSLASASQSASFQESMIKDLIDDAQIQTNQFQLRMSHCDLLTLLKEAVFKQQRSIPESTILLRLPSKEQRVPIRADVERITRVINTYLANALTYSPREAPVTVQLVTAESQALVSVRDEGPGISREEQEHLWERFYRAKGSAVQHELDLSLGLGFYLCRVIIEHHHGHVGVQSDLGKGETFWFTLPMVASPEA